MRSQDESLTADGHPKSQDWKRVEYRTPQLVHYGNISEMTQTNTQKNTKDAPSNKT